MNFPQGIKRLLTRGVAVTGLAALTASMGVLMSSSANASEIKLPPADQQWDYQIGGAYDQPRVGIVSRDRTAKPAAGKYNICYVNGFQTQPGELSWWRSNYPQLVSSQVDEDWGERLLDISTAKKRAALAGVVGRWIDQCAVDGYQAVEIDNLDSYTRSNGAFDEDDAVAYERLLADRAHQAGLAIAQKNGAELLPRKAEMRTDFAIVESAGEYDEYGDYLEAYGRNVLFVEYKQRAFRKGVKQNPTARIVLRDLDVTAPGSRSYVFKLGSN